LDSAPSDRDLVARLLATRDERSFRDLYQRHTPMLYAVALRLSSTEADAMDAVHDAWLRAVDALPSFQWRSTFRTWLCGIVVNRVREVSRSEERMVDLDEQALSDELVELPRGVDGIDLERAIGRLAPRYRQVLILHDAEGFTHEEIAGILGIEPGTSKSQLARGRRRIRMLLEQGDNEP
jgi:RNA polymerase sigma-70 factor (ECF subfamily)